MAKVSASPSCSTLGHDDRLAVGTTYSAFYEHPTMWCEECAPRAEPAPSAAATVRMVDETAKAVMRAQGRDPATWDSLTNEVRDALRLLALDRLRRLA